MATKLVNQLLRSNQVWKLIDYQNIKIALKLVVITKKSKFVEHFEKKLLNIGSKLWLPSLRKGNQLFKVLHLKA